MGCRRSHGKHFPSAGDSTDKIQVVIANLDFVISQLQQGLFSLSLKDLPKIREDEQYSTVADFVCKGLGRKYFRLPENAVDS